MAIGTASENIVNHEAILGHLSQHFGTKISPYGTNKMFA